MAFSDVIVNIHYQLVRIWDHVGDTTSVLWMCLGEGFQKHLIDERRPTMSVSNTIPGLQLRTTYKAISRE